MSWRRLRQCRHNARLFNINDYWRLAIVHQGVWRPSGAKGRRCQSISAPSPRGRSATGAFRPMTRYGDRRRAGSTPPSYIARAMCSRRKIKQMPSPQGLNSGRDVERPGRIIPSWRLAVSLARACGNGADGASAVSPVSGRLYMPRSMQQK